MGRTLAAGALWPDASQEHAGSSLRSTLARLDDGARRALVVTASQLAVTDRLTVDLWESEALADDLREEGSSEPLRVHVRQTHDLSRGPTGARTLADVDEVVATVRAFLETSMGAGTPGGDGDDDVER